MGAAAGSCDLWMPHFHLIRRLCPSPFGKGGEIPSHTAVGAAALGKHCKRSTYTLPLESKLGGTAPFQGSEGHFHREGGTMASNGEDGRGSVSMGGPRAGWDSPALFTCGFGCDGSGALPRPRARLAAPRAREHWLIPHAQWARGMHREPGLGGANGGVRPLVQLPL